MLFVRHTLIPSSLMYVDIVYACSFLAHRIKPNALKPNCQRYKKWSVAGMVRQSIGARKVEEKIIIYIETSISSSRCVPWYACCKTYFVQNECHRATVDTLSGESNTLVYDERYQHIIYFFLLPVLVRRKEGSRVSLVIREMEEKSFHCWLRHVCTMNFNSFHALKLRQYSRLT